MCLISIIYTLGAALCLEASIKITTSPRPRGQQTLSPLRRRDGAAVSRRGGPPLTHHPAS